MIKVGIIGCGAITYNRHAPEYAANPHCEIAGFFDVSEERIKAMKDKYGGKTYPDYQSMLLDESIDAVSICTSNKYHAQMSIEALLAGKHVLCEKPMATTVTEAEEMLAVSRKTGKNLMIGHNQRFTPAHKKAKEILQSGALGRILSFKTTFGHGGPELWSADKSKNTWFFKKSDAFVGAMGDLGIHKIDLIGWLIQDKITEATAFFATLDKTDDSGQLIEVEDNALCLLKSESGIIGTLSASWCYYGEEDNSTIIYCSEGIMRICEDPEFSIVINRKNKEKEYYKIGCMQTNENQSKSGVIDHFIKSIVENTPPETSGEQGLIAMKIMNACIESSETGKTIKIL